jgi:hypothetical protein
VGYQSIHTTGPMPFIYYEKRNTFVIVLELKLTSVLYYWNINGLSYFCLTNMTVLPQDPGET